MVIIDTSSWRRKCDGTRCAVTVLHRVRYFITVLRRMVRTGRGRNCSSFLGPSSPCVFNIYTTTRYLRDNNKFLVVVSCVVMTASFILSFVMTTDKHCFRVYFYQLRSPWFPTLKVDTFVLHQKVFKPWSSAIYIYYTELVRNTM